MEKTNPTLEIASSYLLARTSFMSTNRLCHCERSAAIPTFKRDCFVRFSLVFLWFLAMLTLSPDDQIYAQQISGNKEKTASIVRNVSADFTLIKKRILEDLMRPPVEANEISDLIASINPDGSWPNINYQDTSKTGFQHEDHLKHMLDLSRAYKKEGSVYYQNPEVKKTVLSALDFWIKHDFICENWWWNEMGTPDWMINTLLVLDSDLTENQRIAGAKIASRASFNGFGARAGGDFVPIAGMVCKQALFKNDEKMLENAIKVMADQVVITNGRGINPDLGFHHRTDNVTSIHSYGTNYVKSFTYWTVKTAGTKFMLPEAALKLLVDYYLDGISLAMAFRKYPDPGAKNRDLSRKDALRPASTDIPENFLLSTSYRKKEFEDLIKVRKGEKSNERTWNKYYWHSSYFAHQSKNYFASVRMYSSRQNNMESPYNEEGLKMHHVADGANFLSRSGKEYADIFPVWDWQKIPGTTVVQKPSLPPSKDIAKRGTTDFSGGVSDGKHGAAAFDFSSVHDLLKARKAWFFFDNEYVCLGAGINGMAEFPVATTLNQSLLGNEVVVKTQSGRQTLAKGKHELTEVSWVLHDSVAWLFPSATAVSLNNTMVSGNWRQINHQNWATEDKIEKDLFSLSLNHGTKPKNAEYDYLVVPGMDAASIERYLQKPPVIILSNKPELQGVKHTGLNIVQAVFYQPGLIKLTDRITLTAKSPCLVMVHLKGNSIGKITVSDPTHKLKSLEISFNTKFGAAGTNWMSVWDKDKKLSTVQIDLPAGNEAGKSVVLESGR